MCSWINNAFFSVEKEFENSELKQPIFLSNIEMILKK